MKFKDVEPLHHFLCHNMHPLVLCGIRYSESKTGRAGRSADVKEDKSAPSLCIYSDPTTSWLMSRAWDWFLLMQYIEDWTLDLGGSQINTNEEKTFMFLSPCTAFIPITMVSLYLGP
jgi:hypothetical protein